jgi:hypothetical protein
MKGKSYLPLSADGRWFIGIFCRLLCHFDGKIKVKTTDGKNEKEWMKKK